MASHFYARLVDRLPVLLRRDSGDDSYPWNYTSVNGQLCKMPRPMTNTETATLAGGRDFFTINQIITGSCAIFTIISLLILMFRHATHLSRPNEQLNIMRICCYLPILAVGCFLQVSFPNAYVYINPWLDVVQALALCNFFLVMCQFVSPSDAHRETFFAALELPKGAVSRRRRRRSRKGADGLPEPVNGLVWYRRMWLMIFQYPAVQAAIAVVTAVTESQGVYCLVSSSSHFAHLWLDIIHNISLTMAVVSCLRLISGLRGRLQHHRPLLKLAAFKLLIAITGLIQVSLRSPRCISLERTKHHIRISSLQKANQSTPQLIYWIMRSVNPSPLRPTAYLSWADDFIGIPVLIIALLTVPFSVLFHFAYDVETYKLENVDRFIPLAHRDVESGSSELSGVPKPGEVHVGVSSAGSSYQGGFLGLWAWLAMLNPSELISGFVFGLTMLSAKNREMGINAVRRAQTGDVSGGR